MNDVIIEWQEDNLVVIYGPDEDPHSATLELNHDEAMIVGAMLDDPNMWSTFLGSISAAIGQHK